jgi:hypothetical protein
VSDMRPLGVVIGELRALAANGATGILLIVTEDNRFASISLHNGQIREVSFRRSHNDEAVELLSRVPRVRARFQPGGIPNGRHPPPSDAAIRWLLGGGENQQAAPLPPAALAPSSSGAGVVDRAVLRRQIIEDVAMTYFGPIATLLCEEALSNSADTDQALRQIAANLTAQDEAERFVAEARASLAKAGADRPAR